MKEIKTCYTNPVTHDFRLIINYMVYDAFLFHIHRVITPKIVNSTLGAIVCLKFNVHMVGKDLGFLEVIRRDPDGQVEMVTRLEGQQGTHWRNTTAEFKLKRYGQVRVAIKSQCSKLSSDTGIPNGGEDRSYIIYWRPIAISNLI